MSNPRLCLRHNGLTYCTEMTTAANKPRLCLRHNDTTYYKALTTTADKPRLCLRHNEYADDDAAKVWLPFNYTETFDVTGNVWTAYGTPVIQDDVNAISGKSLYLNGSSYLQMDEGDGITLGGQDFTIDCWCYWGSDSEAYARIFALLGSLTSNSVRLALRFHKENSALAVVVDGGTTYGTISITPDRWAHYALVYTHDTSTMKIYVDGVCQSTFTITLARRTYSQALIGYDTTTADTHLKGCISQFRIFDDRAKWTSNFILSRTGIYYAALMPKYLSSALDFDTSTTLDKCGQTWTAYNSPTISATGAVSGKALQQNSSRTAYLKRTKTFVFTGQPFTISFYFRCPSTAKLQRTYPMCQLAIDSNNRMQLDMHLNGRITFGTEIGGTWSGATGESPNAYNDGQIHHDLIAHKDSVWYWFVDGKLIKTFEYTNPNKTYTLYLLYTATRSSDYFPGSIDKFRFYDGLALHTDVEEFDPALDY